MTQVLKAFVDERERRQREAGIARVSLGKKQNAREIAFARRERARKCDSPLRAADAPRRAAHPVRGAGCRRSSGMIWPTLCQRRRRERGGCALCLPLSTHLSAPVCAPDARTPPLRAWSRRWSGTTACSSSAATWWARCRACTRCAAAPSRRCLLGRTDPLTHTHAHTHTPACALVALAAKHGAEIAVEPVPGRAGELPACTPHTQTHSPIHTLCASLYLFPSHIHTPPSLACTLTCAALRRSTRSCTCRRRRSSACEWPRSRPRARTAAPCSRLCSTHTHGEQP